MPRIWELHLLVVREHCKIEKQNCAKECIVNADTRADLEFRAVRRSEMEAVRNDVVADPLLLVH